MTTNVPRPAAPETGAGFRIRSSIKAGTVSNTLKSQSDTSNAIVQNMK